MNLFQLKKGDLFTLNERKYKLVNFRFRYMPKWGKTLNASCMDLETKKIGLFTQNWEIKRIERIE